MKYSELIKELEYWKRISEEEDPEIVVNDEPYSYEIEYVQFHRNKVHHLQQFQDLLHLKFVSNTLIL